MRMQTDVKQYLINRADELKEAIEDLRLYAGETVDVMPYVHINLMRSIGSVVCVEQESRSVAASLIQEDDGSPG